jgi:hypothetical protein
MSDHSAGNRRVKKLKNPTTPTGLKKIVPDTLDVPRHGACKEPLSNWILVNRRDEREQISPRLGVESLQRIL